MLFGIWKNSTKKLGDEGEEYIAHLLNTLSVNVYKVFNDTLIKTNKYSTQIDHIVVSVYGIFVIETKNRAGWIKGDERSQQWMQIIYRNRYTFYNPIRQNQGHIDALSRFLKVEKNKFIPIVVFVSVENLMVNSKSAVIHASELIDVIEKFNTHQIEHKDLDCIIKKLKSLPLNTKENRNKHAAFVKNLIQEKNELRKRRASNKLCPDCGLPLLVRKGKYGFFLGCSNYPRCNYTQNLQRIDFYRNSIIFKNRKKYKWILLKLLLLIIVTTSTCATFLSLHTTPPT